MKRIINGALTALTTLSRIPVPWRFETDYGRFGFFLPWVGFISAVPVWAGFLLSGLVPKALSTPVAVAALGLQYWLFNLFHFDGLLDSADGLLFQGSRERRLEIMKDSRTGSFALFVGVLYLVAKVSLVRSIFDLELTPLQGLAVFFVVSVSARSACAAIPGILKSARPGFGSLLSPYRLFAAALGFVFVTAILAMIYVAAKLDIIGFAVSYLIPAALTVLIIGFTFKTRIGGYTGDTLGATVEIGELLCLIGVVAVLS